MNAAEGGNKRENGVKDNIMPEKDGAAENTEHLYAVTHRVRLLLKFREAIVQTAETLAKVRL